MGDLSEVVFEGVPPNQTSDLLGAIVAKGEIESITYGNDFKERTIQELQTLLPSKDFGYVHVRRLTLRTNVVLNLVLIRIFVGDNGVIIVDFTFETDDIKAGFKENILELHQLVDSLAQRFQVNRYYAGMEPADDEDTRYFTDKQKGPLFPVSL